MGQDALSNSAAAKLRNSPAVRSVVKKRKARLIKPTIEAYETKMTAKSQPSGRSRAKECLIDGASA